MRLFFGGSSPRCYMPQICIVDAKLLFSIAHYSKVVPAETLPLRCLASLMTSLTELKIIEVPNRELWANWDKLVVSTKKIFLTTSNCVIVQWFSTGSLNPLGVSACIATEYHTTPRKVVLWLWRKHSFLEVQNIQETLPDNGPLKPGKVRLNGRNLNWYA